MTEVHTERLQAALASRYRIERKIGEGGMATVYLAEDLKHERKVALKIFRPELAAMLGAERFLAEIKTTANLQHPHILPLFDSGSADGFLYYVMPHVEGESLRERLDRETQLGVEEAVRIARDVGDALDYAHRHGVIHRDVKPANILLHDGRPVVSDFGIALAVSAAGGGRMTETGLSLGTPHYMSPEQASAERELSAKSDVYSLGCVVYEMLAGQPPHTGPTAQSILVRILTEDPRPVQEVRRSVPPHVAAAVNRAIEKLPADRFDTAAAFVTALSDASFTYTTSGVSEARAAGARAVGGSFSMRRAITGKHALPWALLAASLVVGVWGWSSRPSPAQISPTTALTLDLAGLPEPRLGSIVISPDGSRFAVPTGAGVYVRSASEPSFTPLPGTEGVTEVTFSPDGAWMAYGQGNALRKISVSGSSPLTLASIEVPTAVQPHWGATGSIVFVAIEGINMVSDDGTGLVSFDVTGQRPHLLPDGSGFLFEDRTAVMFFDLATGSSRELIAEGANAQYVPSGHILFVHPRGGLFAVTFDLDSHEVRGQPVPVLSDLGAQLGTGALYSVAETGTLVYRRGGNDLSDSRLLLLSPDGSTEPIRIAARDFAHVRFSPDGGSIAFNEGSGRTSLRALFTYDLVLGALTQVASDGGEHSPVWSPDGTQLAYSIQLEAGSQGEDIYVRALAGDAPPRRVARLPGDQHANAWTEGGVLALSSVGDLITVEASGTDAAPVSYLRGGYTEVDIAISPDERLAAYNSDEDGTPNVYVRRFPEPEGQRRVSTAGGVAPRWNGDGSILYYRSLSLDTIYAVPFAAGTPVGVGTASVAWIVRGANSEFWDVDRTSGRAVVAQLVEGGATTATASVTVIVNWLQRLEGQVGRGP